MELSDTFIKNNGIPWPNAYGANKAIEDLEVKVFPTEIVVGKDGKIAWHSSLAGETAAAIRKALAAN
ncbi:MAG: hypothetical protein GY768_32305 [Planctomycetaceae bacterium]|nr:hypothetical protein [Planctomycetaceae bacterium]